jgi:hypothetical protein
MTEEEINRALVNRKFYKAEQEAGFAENHPGATPQQLDPAYRLAFRDTDFLLREELRPVRFQLELLKAEMLLEEADIGSTLVIYGSARIPSPEHAQAALDAATTPERKAVVERLVAKSKYYDEARELARLASACGVVEEGKRQFVVCSGGGPRSWKRPIAARSMSAPIPSGSTSCCPTNSRPTLCDAPPLVPVPLFRAAQDALPDARAPWRCSPAALARSTNSSSCSP